MQCVHRGNARCVEEAAEKERHRGSAVRTLWDLKRPLISDNAVRTSRQCEVCEGSC